MYVVDYLNLSVVRYTYGTTAEHSKKRKENKWKNFGVFNSNKLA